MKSADEIEERPTFQEYADLAEDWVQKGAPVVAQIYATLAHAAATARLADATLEAARLMGPTPEDQARLDALGPLKSRIACGQPWTGSMNCTENGGSAHQCARKDQHSDRHLCLCGALL
jgi:hypothetical protein